MRTHTLDGNEPSNKEIREHFERLSATRFRVERQMVAMLLDRQTAMLDALRWCISELCIDGTNSPKMAEFRALIAAIEGEK